MMTIFSLIKKFNAKGISLWQEDGQLKFKAPKGALTDELRAELVANKEDIIAFYQRVSERSKISSILPVSRTDEDGSPIQSFPLSFAQERLWFLSQMEPDSAAYNISEAVTISSSLNIDHLELAFNLMIARHENLRTIFTSHEGLARQVILESVDFKLESIDLSHYESNETRHQKAKQLCQTQAETPFDLTRGPLVRGKLIKLTEQEHILMLTMHHIISDGWSMGIMIKEFGLIVGSLLQGQQPNLTPLPIQYLDYSIWQRNLLGEERPEKESLLQQQLAYWQEKLTGVPESSILPTDYPRHSVQNSSGAKHTFHLDTKLARQLTSLAEEQGCSLFMTLMAVYKVLHYRYTGQEDICLGSPIANRQYEETHGLIGMFANTLAFRTQLAGEASFTSLLSQIKATCLEAYEHQDTPFEKIVDRVQPDRSLAISPLFQVMFILQNASKNSTEQYIQSYPLEAESCKFDLSIALTETTDGIVGAIEYRTSLYNKQTIERVAKHFKSLCQAITTTPTAKICELEFIGTAERQQLLVDYNKTQVDYPKDKCIHELFVEQVSINPNKIAVVHQNETLSYQQLYDKSHALALYLQSQGVQPDSLVGLCVERSLDMMVGILGILQAGGAYVPLDPDYPDDRLAHMLQDSQTDIVLTQEKLQDKLSNLITKDTKLIVLDEHWSEISDCVAELKVKQVKLQQEVKSHHLAYMIYTSGSTGKSKGVGIEHKGVINMILSQIEGFSITKDDNCLQNFSFCFDGAVSEMYLALLSGASLIITSNDEKRDPIKFVNCLTKHNVSVATITPSFLAAIGEKSLPLRVIITAGESANKNALRYHLENKIDCFNAYGPTESSVCATYYKIKLEDTQLNTIPIGRPINNTQIYILDQRNNPVPIGVPGELHIAGDGLARGYPNRLELTEEKFISNPYEPHTRMYKSGDLARWLDDGNVEYLGRIDTQVKIRGFRIELGEIESQFNQYPEINNSVVIVQELEGNKNLIAYYVARDTKKDHIVHLANEDLRAYLQQTLPEYMLPVAYVSLEAIPLTPNGKVDRRVLEHMTVSLESSQAYLAPRNEVETQLVAIWAELLNLNPKNIGINDNFFELGGNSLMATQLTSRIRNQLDIEFDMRALFKAKTVAAVAEVTQAIKAQNEKPSLSAELESVEFEEISL